MADRIIKGDSGNDVIIQNNDASRKIEVTNSGDVEVTGDFKATTVKATNLKANDGTASLVVADSTGEVTSSGGLKAVNLKATNLKANDGTASLEIADSTGDVGFSGNTDLKIKLPSAGGIYESDGSTAILIESSGDVTLQNVKFNDGNKTDLLSEMTCKAWVNFDGSSGAESIRDDYNVSSVVDAGTGRYKINFDTTMSGRNYAVCVSGGTQAAGTTSEGMQVSTFNQLVGSVNITSWAYDGSGYLDLNQGCIIVFGD